MVLEGEGGAPEQLVDVSVTETDQWGHLFAGESGGSLSDQRPNLLRPKQGHGGGDRLLVRPIHPAFGQIRDLLRHIEPTVGGQTGQHHPTEIERRGLSPSRHVFHLPEGRG